MVVKIGNSDENNENQGEAGNSEKWSRSIWLSILVVLFILILVAFSVVNLPGRYKAIVVNDLGVVLILDTAKGNIWSYFGDINSAIITYQGKLKAGEKIPERIVVKGR